jgi:hypothetical protein
MTMSITEKKGDNTFISLFCLSWPLLNLYFFEDSVSLDEMSSLALD